MTGCQPKCFDPDLQDRRPDHAGDVLAGRDQRERGAAAAVEPAADVDDQRRVDRAVAQEADQQAMPDIQRPDACPGWTAPARPPSPACRSRRSCGCRSGRPASPSGSRRRHCRSRPGRSPAPPPSGRCAAPPACRAVRRRRAAASRTTATGSPASGTRPARTAATSMLPAASRCMDVFFPCAGPVALPNGRFACAGGRCITRLSRNGRPDQPAVGDR